MIPVLKGRLFSALRKQCYSTNFGRIVYLEEDIATGNESTPVGKPDDSPGASDPKEDDVPKYTKLSDDSNVLGQYMTKVKSRRMREKSKMVLLEGKRLIQDAIHSNNEPCAIFFSRIKDVKTLNIKDTSNLYRTSYKSLQLWSDVTTSQGVLGFFKIPETIKKDDEKSSLPLTIICDNIRDPGNMGSILRTTAACGCRRLLLTQGCVDIWDSKVLRAASGAHFRFSIHYDKTWDEIAGILPENYSVVLANSNASDRLNSFQNQPTVDLPAIPYFKPVFKIQDELVLILGGETEGLSESAYQLAANKKGSRVYIPLENGIESLNSGTALAIICYEIRRQILEEKSLEKFESVGLYCE